MLVFNVVDMLINCSLINPLAEGLYTGIVWIEHKMYVNFVYRLLYFPVDNARYLYIKSWKFVKNEHVQYTVEYFPVDNARVIYTKGLNS
jgi:hypothetical protein